LHDRRGSLRKLSRGAGVALAPAIIPNLTKAGLEVVIEAGAGTQAGYLDDEYSAKGGKILAERAEVFRAADIVVQVLCYGSNDRTGKAGAQHAAHFAEHS